MSRTTVIQRQKTEQEPFSDIPNEINRIMEIFSRVSNTDKADSVINKAFKSLNPTTQRTSVPFSNFYSAVNAENNLFNTNVITLIPTGKAGRIREYERMATNSEVDTCLDEICDAAVNNNERGQVIEITFNNFNFIPNDATGKAARELQELKESIINKEFFKFIQPLNLKHKLYRYVKTFLKTGECCFENVIDTSNPKAGIVDFKFIPSHSYDYAYDQTTQEKMGIWVKVLQTGIGNSLNFEASGMPFIGAANMTSYTGNQYNLTNYNRFSEYTNNQDLLFLPFEQLTYIDSGDYSANGLIVYPILERARRAFNQLQCIEDSIIIYRLARAPTRLVFNVDMGLANSSKSAQELQKLIRRYNVAKSYNSATGGTANSLDNHTMTESFFFMKSPAGTGTDVTELSSTVSLGELPDLNYFQKKLWAALHISPKRFLSESESVLNSKDNLTADELRFYKFVIRTMSNFSEAIKASFITHMKLTGHWEKLDIDETFFELEFCAPLSYTLYEEGRVLEQRMAMYTSVLAEQGLSKTVAMKRYLNMTKEDIVENTTYIEEEKVREKLIEAKAQAIADSEMILFNKRLDAERAVKEKEMEEQNTYDTTEEVIEDNLSGIKSDEVKQKGVQQLAKRAALAQQGMGSNDYSFDNSPSPVQQTPETLQ